MARMWMVPYLCAGVGGSSSGGGDRGFPHSWCRRGCLGKDADSLDRRKWDRWMCCCQMCVRVVGLAELRGWASNRMRGRSIARPFLAVLWAFWGGGSRDTMVSEKHGVSESDSMQLFACVRMLESVMRSSEHVLSILVDFLVVWQNNDVMGTASSSSLMN
eukprot:1138629-Pelagomonas_calceolata.AAC.5